MLPVLWIKGQEKNPLTLTQTEAHLPVLKALYIADPAVGDAGAGREAGTSLAVGRSELKRGTFFFFFLTFCASLLPNCRRDMED